MTNAVTVSAPPTGTVNTALAITGTVSPATDTVLLQLSTQNVTLPTGAWTAASTVAGVFNGVLTPGYAGNFYVWAVDQATGQYAVSQVITVPNLTLPVVVAAPYSNGALAASVSLSNPTIVTSLPATPGRNGVLVGPVQVAHGYSLRVPLGSRLKVI